MQKTEASVIESMLEKTQRYTSYVKEEEEKQNRELNRKRTVNVRTVSGFLVHF